MFGENNGSVILNIFRRSRLLILRTGTDTTLLILAGTYTYTVTDNQNYSFTNTVIITEPQELLVSENISNVLCKDENSGSVILNISGGTTPYNENWGELNPNMHCPMEVIVM